MPTLIIHPTQLLSLEAFDAYLTAGFRPAGQSVYFADYLRPANDGIYGCIQIRLPLKNFVFKPKHRRMLRQHGARFRTEIALASRLPDAEMYEVNTRYAAVFPDKTRLDLEFHLCNEANGLRTLHTYCAKVYDGEKLIAFSFFDVGKTVVYTKAGIYDPAYADYSLGTYTILLELDWAVHNGFRYYHPGYYAPAYPVFHYKLRFGPADYRDWQTGEWHPLPNNDPDFPPDPYAHNLAALEELQRELMLWGVSATLLEYPSCTARFHYPGTGGGLLDAPLVLKLRLGPEGVIVFDNQTQQYVFCLTASSGLRDVKVRIQGPSGLPRSLFPLRALGVLVEGKTTEEFLTNLREEL